MSNIRSLHWYKAQKAMGYEERLRLVEESFNKDITYMQDMIFVLQQRIARLEKGFEDVKDSGSKTIQEE